VRTKVFLTLVFLFFSFSSAGYSSSYSFCSCDQDEADWSLIVKRYDFTGNELSVREYSTHSSYNYCFSALLNHYGCGEVEGGIQRCECSFEGGMSSDYELTRYILTNDNHLLASQFLGVWQGGGQCYGAASVLPVCHF